MGRLRQGTLMFELPASSFPKGGRCLLKSHPRLFKGASPSSLCSPEELALSMLFSRIAELWGDIAVVSVDTSSVRLPSSPDAARRVLPRADPAFLG